MTPKAGRGRPQEAQIKIRNYLINLVYHQKGGQVEKLPPYEELAEKLGVARSSLQIAVKQLVAEGYLVTKPGIGTFSHPERRLNKYDYYAEEKLIGLIVMDGKSVYHQYFIWTLTARVGEAFGKYCTHLQLLTLGSYNDDAIADEILSAGLDGLVWINPPPERFGMIRGLARKLPLVVSDINCPGVHSVSFDNYGSGHRLAEDLLKRGKRTLAMSPCFARQPEKVEGAKKAFAEQGVPFDEQLVYLDREAFPAQLARDLEAGKKPDAICFHPEETQFLLPFLKEHGVSLPGDCLPVIFAFRPAGVEMPMLVQTLDIDLFADTTAELLFELMTGCNPEADSILISPILKFVE